MIVQQPGGRPQAGGPDWVRDAVFYQIFPDRFASSARLPKPGALERWDAPPTFNGFKGGDLIGIAEHLDDLRELGITALYLNPVFASASNHRYHTYDYELVDPLLGGDAALRTLLDEAHSRGMRVILDGVFNHASRGFWPFHHVLENGAASPYRDWFRLDASVLSGGRGLNAYPGRSEMEAMDRMRGGHGAAAGGGPDLAMGPGGSSPGAGGGVGAHPDGPAAAGPRTAGPGTPSQWVLGYQAWWDLPALPKLNHSNPAVRDYIFGVAERWTRFGIDGWRLDVPEDINEPGFWEEFRRRVLAINPEAYLVGEIWTPARDWLRDRFDALMNYPLAESILSFVGAGRLDHELVARTHEYGRHVRDIDGPEFGRQLAEVMATYPPEIASLQLNLLDSHDTPRFLSLAGGDATALRLAALIQMTLPGAPCIYYGDEVGLEGRQDPDCRRAYPWDPARQDRGLRDFYAGVVAMRHANPVLRRGRFELLAADGSAVAYRMFDPEASAGASAKAGSATSIIVAINTGNQPARLTVERPGPAGHRLEQVSWPGRDWRTTFAPTLIDGGPLVIEVEPREGVAIQAISIL